jgi:hypothetical protein
MSSTAMTNDAEQERKRRVRRNAILLGLTAVAFYAIFIVLSLARH